MRKYFIFLLMLTALPAFSQSLVEDANLSASAAPAEGVFTETIKVISNSRKIFVLTNSNAQLGMGDFISLALDNKLAARALVAKSHQGQVGIKILKIYSLAQWSKLRRDQEVQIVRGDDSNFGVAQQPTTEKSAPTESRIKTEDDLFSESVVEDDKEDFDEQNNRNIKPDNVVAIFGGFLNANQTDTEGGGTVRATEYGLSWAYQFADNYFVEAAYSRALFDNYPGDGSQTLVNHVIGRLKYNFKGPLYTFFMPYIGFHTYSISSPDAGKTDNELVNDEQISAVDKLKKQGPAFGVTVLRRLVPGWFVQANLGSDVINLGVSIEF